MNAVSKVFIGVFIFMCLCLFWIWFCFGPCVKRRQKTRRPQQNRTYMGSRPRQSLTQSVDQPTIFVSPANLPPPPKYEAMAPPSYEEVVGIHYPAYRPPQFQPITHPITSTLAQESNATMNTWNTVPNANSNNIDGAPATVITVSGDDRTTSVTVATS